MVYKRVTWLSSLFKFWNIEIRLVVGKSRTAGNQADVFQMLYRLENHVTLSNKSPFFIPTQIFIISQYCKVHPSGHMNYNCIDRKFNDHNNFMIPYKIRSYQLLSLYICIESFVIISVIEPARLKIS